MKRCWTVIQRYTIMMMIFGKLNRYLVTFYRQFHYLRKQNDLNDLNVNKM